jgi:predicted amidohydrolase YtcJ
MTYEINIKYRVNNNTIKLSYVLCLVTCILCLMIMSSCKTHKEHADYIYINGKVYTVDDDMTICQSFAIADGKFLATGTNEEIQNAFTSENIIDLKGKVVYPGLIDGHCHFLNYALNLQYADLSKAKSIDEVIDILKAYRINNPSDWLLGIGWNENNWDKKIFPDNKMLDKAFPYFPVALQRIDGHTILANTLALKKADITKDKQIEGGKIIIKNGEMTGLLIDKAAEIMYNRAFRANSRKKAKALVEAQYKCFAAGLTTVVEGGLDKKDIDIIDTLQTRGKLFMRIYAMISATDNNKVLSEFRH